MLFNSTGYLLLFLPAAVIGFILLARSGRPGAQLLWLILASLFFYGLWNPIYLILILASIICNYGIGRLIYASTTSRNWLLLGICFNLGLLGYFKYSGFFIENINALGLIVLPVPEIVLPLAISFFTFQQIAYLVDVHRRLCAEYSFGHYALFVLFFPQLIAGPIVHHREMMPQFERMRGTDKLWTDLAVGSTIIAIGLFKKVIIADSLAGISDPLYDAAASGTELSMTDAWIAALSFSFQIYFDFSGYTDMAIGSARLLGITLPENFNSPYKSTSTIAAWRRWHITLSRFLRDYLYIAMGGNRHGKLKRYRNLVLTMLIGGLWHGATWNFVVWGGLHGMFLVVNHSWRALVRKLSLEAICNSPLLKPVFIGITFIAWMYAFVFFRAQDLDTGTAIVTATLPGNGVTNTLLAIDQFKHSALAQLFSAFGYDITTYQMVYLGLIACAFVCWALPNTQTIMRNFNPVLKERDDITWSLPLPAWKPQPAFAIATSLILFAGIFGMGAVAEFIYFQF